jgi:hypothetical protein
VATQDFVIRLFCLVDDRLAGRHKHPQAQLWPSELITIGLLFALKGCSFRSFYQGAALRGYRQVRRLVRVRVL